MKESSQSGMAGMDAELGSSINEKAIVRKLNKHILLKFFLMCILCYIGEAPTPYIFRAGDMWGTDNEGTPGKRSMKSLRPHHKMLRQHEA
jgi:hypothetical protein